MLADPALPAGWRRNPLVVLEHMNEQAPKVAESSTQDRLPSHGPVRAKWSDASLGNFSISCLALRSVLLDRLGLMEVSASLN